MGEIHFITVITANKIILLVLNRFFVLIKYCVALVGVFFLLDDNNQTR